LIQQAMATLRRSAADVVRDRAPADARGSAQTPTSSWSWTPAAGSSEKGTHEGRAGLSKINAQWHGVAEAAEGLERNLERLGLDYVDLLLLHWPNPARDRYVHGWEGLIALREQGRARAIGVSNFKPKHLQRIMTETGVTPEVNQIERHPYLIRSAAVAFHAQHGIVTEGWSPLGRDNGLFEDPVVAGIAAEVGRSASQVLLRWAVQQGHAVAVKSKSRERQAENLAVFDFSLTSGQIADLNSLDSGEHKAVDSDVFGH
jgi:2,5-diketo-D-gluconate reductase A